MSLKSTLRNEAGSVAILFGLAIIPIVGLAGMALDYSRAAALKTELQAALDMTALAVARMPANATQEQLNSTAKIFFDANFASLANYDFQPIATRGERTVRVSASGTMPTSLTAILGFDNMEIKQSAEVGWGTMRTELALVLDNTGSMAELGKMEQLKVAAKGLVEDFRAIAFDEDAVKIAVVPFSQQVRLNTENDDAAWLRFLPEGSGTAAPGGQTVSDADDNLVKKSAWNGCLEDRDRNYDVDDTAPTADPSTAYRAVQCIEAPVEILPLTSIYGDAGKTKVTDKIDEMSPHGYTNITIGLAWGLAALSKYAPLTVDEPEAGVTVSRYMIMLTDGKNTKNRWDQQSEDTTGTNGPVDQRTKLACDAVKEKGITLYTVRVIEGNIPLLTACASGEDNYRNVDAAAKLEFTLEEIAREMIALRVTH